MCIESCIVESRGKLRALCGGGMLMGSWLFRRGGGCWKGAIVVGLVVWESLRFKVEWISKFGGLAFGLDFRAPFRPRQNGREKENKQHEE